MSISNIEAFLKGVVGGDGTPHTKGPGFQIYTCSLSFAQDICELAMLSNKAANIYKIASRTRVFPNGRETKCKEQFIASIVTTNDTLVRGDTIKVSEKYQGFVYNVELPKYCRLYVMRNGKACWCGN